MARRPRHPLGQHTIEFASGNVMQPRRYTVVAVLCFLICCADARGSAIKTELVQRDGKWQLLRDGKPYFIKGVGGSGPKAMLAELGGNSFRTWGADNLGPQLDEA